MSPLSIHKHFATLCSLNVVFLLKKILFMRLVFSNKKAAVRSLSINDTSLIAKNKSIIVVSRLQIFYYFISIGWHFLPAWNGIHKNIADF